MANGQDPVRDPKYPSASFIFDEIILCDLTDFLKSLAKQPNSALKLFQHLAKIFFSFLMVLINKLAKNYVKIW